MRLIQGSTHHYLAVDIGGTKTEVAAYSLGDSSFTPIVKERYPSNEADGIEEIIGDFLGKYKIAGEYVCLGIAGVVGKSRAQVTNLPWEIKKENLTGMGFTAVCMINDLTAVAASLPLLADSDLFCLQQGAGILGELSAVLAPGTGLGEGFLLHTDTVFYPRGTEGGHSDFAPADEEQQTLLRWLSAGTQKTVDYEMVCAGRAVGTLYDFYLAQGEVETGRIRDELAEISDRTPVIIEAALSNSCPVCRKVLNLFLSILGREGASLVLKVYATRGLFLGGGILPRLVGVASFEPFLKAFFRPGTMTDLLASVPIKVILRKDAALLGAACYGSSIFKGDQVL